MNDDEKVFLDDLLEAESGLTPWEIDFIESLDKQRERSLTSKQAACLATIVERVL